MIDAIDILLLEVGSVNLIQLTRRCKVVAERLLNNNALQPRLLDAGVMKIFRNQFVKQRRSSQIEQVIPIILILGRQSFQPLVQPGISKSIGRVHRLIVDSGKKIIQWRFLLFIQRRRLRQLLLQIAAIGFIRIGSAGTSHNGKVRRKTSFVVNLHQGRHQLAPGEVARCAEYN